MVSRILSEESSWPRRVRAATAVSRVLDRTRRDVRRTAAVSRLGNRPVLFGHVPLVPAEAMEWGPVVVLAVLVLVLIVIGIVGLRRRDLTSATCA